MHFKAPLCEAKREEIIFLDGDFSSASQFFLTVGVFAFLYSLLATIVYVFYQNNYLKNNRGPLVVSELISLTNIHIIIPELDISYSVILLCLYNMKDITFTILFIHVFFPLLSRISLLHPSSPSCGS